jgi:hypothetical protein
MTLEIGNIITIMKREIHFSSTENFGSYIFSLWIEKCHCNHFDYK